MLDQLIEFWNLVSTIAALSMAFVTYFIFFIGLPAAFVIGAVFLLTDKFRKHLTQTELK